MGGDEWTGGQPRSSLFALGEEPPREDAGEAHHGALCREPPRPPGEKTSQEKGYEGNELSPVTKSSLLKEVGIPSSGWRHSHTPGPAQSLGSRFLSVSSEEERHYMFL